MTALPFVFMRSKKRNFRDAERQLKEEEVVLKLTG